MRTETIVIELVPDVPWRALADERAARVELLTGHTRDQVHTGAGGTAFLYELRWPLPALPGFFTGVTGVSPELRSC